MKIIAGYVYSTRARALFGLMILALTGCAQMQPHPRATVYDFGPGPVVDAPANRMANLPALVLAEVDTSAALDSTAVLYRLAYSDAQQLRPYAQARWSMTPAQLLRQRLREHLGQRRAVLNAAQGLAISQSAKSMSMHVELDEFSQLFDSAEHSTGLVRLRATVGQANAGADRLVAQRSFVVQRPAPTQDAAGGVRALTLAVDAVVAEIAEWLEQVEKASAQ
ncbi:ABC-type transport auxiliary lipoprotein family protein [Candidatus Aalborgicola defluviihabitans]|uniref:ABC-type transport auxiliary lipoprotein family protein n=1 Tax=Candidatus Aalborgicola defluviihabitans TaxID=3386187 RepID=UPI001D7DA09B|nr:membrane integrity-associated transporter subunit PqiC [Burkholderiales bacterium]MBK7281763.1 membrane integrity-associated transporter subunit PqiC [Burkholderiales bacterium]